MPGRADAMCQTSNDSLCSLSPCSANSSDAVVTKQDKLIRLKEPTQIAIESPTVSEVQCYHPRHEITAQRT